MHQDMYSRLFWLLVKLYLWGGRSQFTGETLVGRNKYYDDENVPAAPFSLPCLIVEIDKINTTLYALLTFGRLEEASNGRDVNILNLGIDLLVHRLVQLMTEVGTKPSTSFPFSAVNLTNIVIQFQGTDVILSLDDVAGYTDLDLHGPTKNERPSGYYQGYLPSDWMCLHLDVWKRQNPTNQNATRIERIKTLIHAQYDREQFQRNKKHLIPDPKPFYPSPGWGMPDRGENARPGSARATAPPDVSAGERTS